MTRERRKGTGRAPAAHHQATEGPLRRSVRRSNERRKQGLAHQTDRLALQALAEGDLSERARRRAAELANDADLRLSPPKVKAAPAASTLPEAGRTVTGTLADKPDERLPLPGTILTREYKGSVVQVQVLPNGFEYAGEVYKSLSAVAKAVTGQHVNGFAFFKLGQQEAK